MSCPICEKRPPKRFCPAMGEKICAVCCGREREVTIACPQDCSYLITAHRYEAEHREPISREALPYPKVEFQVEFIYERWPVLSGIAATILNFQTQHKDLNDAAVLSALEALAETYRTLGTGIYYERPPDLPVAHALYGAIAEFLQQVQNEQVEGAGFPPLKESDILNLLVFLLRVGKQETNGRPRSRAFLAFLRTRVPLAAEATKEASRIIVP
jgi:hypothetical protein